MKHKTNNQKGNMSETMTKREVKSLPGLMTCNLDLHISSATADFKWTGPKISRELWWQILAFFEWTQATARSESQVRLFVREGEWSAWAFPQQANTGMTTKELPEEASWKEQRAKFSDADGWYYWGTVHHHCSAGAFQSSTDQQDEKDQDGMHITVGKIGSPRYDLDVRIYQSRWKMPAPDLSHFWDIGLIAASEIPAQFHGLVAQHQMCTPPPKDYAFPEEWRANYIVPKPKETYALTSTPEGWRTQRPRPLQNDFTDDHFGYFVEEKNRLPSDITMDLMFTYDRLSELVKEKDAEWEDILQFLHLAASDTTCNEICRLLWLNDLTPGALYDHLEKQLTEEAAKEMAQETMKQEGGLVTGFPGCVD